MSHVRVASLALSVLTATAQPLLYNIIPQSFADSFGAKCLDGSPPGYYFLPGDPTKWIFFVEGGGWCSSIGDCANRAASSGGNTGAGPNNPFDAGGVLSPNATTNPTFHNYSMVFLHYCDGSSHSSAADAPIPVPPELQVVSKITGKAITQIWMRGRANLKAAIYHLLTAKNMTRATEFIFSGGSAGGVSVYYAADVVGEWLAASNPGIRFVAFPDAGFFVDGVSIATNEHTYRQMFIDTDKFWNTTGSGGVSRDCLAFYAAEPWHCLLVQYLFPFVQTPTFIMMSALDMWSVMNIRGEGCLPNCTSSELEIVNDWRNQQIAAVAVAAANRPGTGMYLPTCFVHEQNVDYCSGQSLPNCRGWLIYQVTTPTFPVAKVTPQQAFSYWYTGLFEDGTALPEGLPVQIIDPLAWPENLSCPYPANGVTVGGAESSMVPAGMNDVGAPAPWMKQQQ